MSDTCRPDTCRDYFAAPKYPLCDDHLNEHVVDLLTDIRDDLRAIRLTTSGASGTLSSVNSRSASEAAPPGGFPRSKR